MHIGVDKPTIKLLLKYRDEIAPYWRNLGMQLLQEEYIHKLNIIEKNHPNDAEHCCDKMFECWLRVDVEANWNKLVSALEHIQQNATAAKVRQDILAGKPYMLVSTPNNYIVTC